jgi:dCTP deaminase
MPLFRVPGVLNSDQMRELFTKKLVTWDRRLPEPTLDCSSMDLRLADEAFEMVGGAVKPLKTSGKYENYRSFLEDQQLAKSHPKVGNGTYQLDRTHTYVFRLEEILNTSLRGLGIYGEATAKSSVGRVDVLARLIVDGMDTYECFTPQGLEKSSGEMFLEITPITFNVLVRPGDSLSQLRFFYGNPDDALVRGKDFFQAIFPGTTSADGSLTVDLSEVDIADEPAAAFCAVDRDDAVPLWEDKSKKEPKPNPADYWQRVRSVQDRLKIEKNKFYILRSREKIALPEGIAVYCRAIDETIGEMRIHYAGFVHPWWGLVGKDGKSRPEGKEGSPLIFEVRGHQVDVSLAHGEKMANLRFYRMSRDAPQGSTAYAEQSLQLSKFFAEWQ